VRGVFPHGEHRNAKGAKPRGWRFCTNPAAELPLPRHVNCLAERILPEEDVQRLLAAETDPRDKTLLKLIYLAGVRVSEATQLRWRNLRPRADAGQITVLSKGGATRAITLPPAM
jgi:site-specific recombinase XerD